MSLADIIINGVERIAGNAEIKKFFQYLDGETLVVNLIGDSTVTFTVNNGELAIREGEAQDAPAITDIEPQKFVGFINGETPFGGLFTIEFPEYLQPRKGKLDEMGGDFWLLTPISGGLTQLYWEDSEFRGMVDSFTHPISKT
jgi:hypothetical protein